MNEKDIIQGRVETFLKVLHKIPEVRYAGDLVLRTPATPVEFEEGLKIGWKLGEIIVLYRKVAGYGRGLAAPQIGISKSVFTTYINDQVQIIINPQIIDFARTKNYFRELCLSSGILSADVARPEWVVMKWINQEGVEVREKVDGLLARLYQHEEAHLRGKLNLDECESGGIEIAVFDPLKEQLRTSR